MRAITAGTVLLLACQSAVVSNPPEGSDGIVLSTAQSSYRAGTEAELRLSNGTPGDLGYNLCTSQLQRLEGGSWVQAPVADHVCTMELRLLQTGSTASFRYPLRATLPAGQYRFITTVEQIQSGDRSAAVSNAFTLTR